jgi:hypothetical protein
MIGVTARLADHGVDWPAWVSAGATVATCLVIGLTAFFAWRALRDARLTRHGLLITEIMRDWTQPTVIEANHLHSSYGGTKIAELVKIMFAPGEEPEQKDIDDWAQLALVANLIETLGVLASEKAVTAEVVYKMWGGAILTAWPKWEEAIGLLRKYDNEPDTFIYFEAIATDIRRIRDEHRLAADP